jgi:hypothetical protein
MTATEPRSREQFEVWYSLGGKRKDLILPCAGDHSYYAYGETNRAWDTWQAATAAQSAELRRLRISQLRRMGDLISERIGDWGRILDEVPQEFRMENSWRRRWYRRMCALRDRCRAEIERLRGEG